MVLPIFSEMLNCCQFQIHSVLAIAGGADYEAAVTAELETGSCDTSD